MSPLITLLTDFGDLDPFVGIMKGVIAGLAPGTQCVDLTHNIAPGDIRAGAYQLQQAAPYFPPDTVHLAVVDPGVGSARRAIAAATDQGIFVGPDNGLFTYVYELHNCLALVELAEPRYRLPTVSSTFHGRDIFSPAAAYLACGVAIEAFGPPVSDPVRFPLPRFYESPARAGAASGGRLVQISGQVIHGDRFGNLATSIAWLTWEDDDTLNLEPWLAGQVARSRFRASQARVRVGAKEPPLVGIRRTFSDVAVGEAAAIVGSERHLDLVVNRGSALEVLKVDADADVVVSIEPFG